ncbi:hypothetical protein INT47_003931 [Mucor saturninus]|uniref:Adhesin domain-containing protein n=1 Tax=Mucor saturninus TaxID=64648 RepID=A0A8H7UTJ1_9FUNG|nr:hypothetical protein INT47_003931 [Mucor saturninus]
MSESSHIQPNFFGSGYGEQPKKKSGDWVDFNNPTAPPPYSPVPHEPTGSSRPTTHPSAPPLDLPNYGYYGSVPYPTPNTTSDVNQPTWPWAAPPSMPVPPSNYISPSSLPPPLQLSSSSPPGVKKHKNWCEISVKYLFYVFCLFLVIRMVELLTRGTGYGGSCAHGVEWSDLPPEFNYNKGIKIRTVGGHLSSGQIKIQTIGAEDLEKTGKVRMSALIFPPRLAKNSDLSFAITHFTNGTSLELYIPQDLDRNACITFNAVIYVPEGTPYIELDMQNTRVSVSDETLSVPVVGITTTNAPIEFHGAWEGEALLLSTKNAIIELTKYMSSSQVIMITTTNAAIRVRQTLQAYDTMYISTTNGAIDVDDLIYCDRLIELRSSNSHINAYNVTASIVRVLTSNGRINIDHGNAVELFNTQTTNGQVNVHVDTGAYAEMSIRTSNAEITASLPSDYEGHFLFDAGTHNKLTFIDEIGWSQIDSMNKGHISGRRIEPGHTDVPNTRVQVQTTNANAHIHF